MRIALVENEQRIRQAARNIKKFFGQAKGQYFDLRPERAQNQATPEEAEMAARQFLKVFNDRPGGIVDLPDGNQITFATQTHDSSNLALVVTPAGSNTIIAAANLVGELLDELESVAGRHGYSPRSFLESRAVYLERMVAGWNAPKDPPASAAAPSRVATCMVVRAPSMPSTPLSASSDSSKAWV